MAFEIPVGILASLDDFLYMKKPSNSNIGYVKGAKRNAFWKAGYMFFSMLLIIVCGSIAFEWELLELNGGSVGVPSSDLVSFLKEYKLTFDRSGNEIIVKRRVPVGFPPVPRNSWPGTQDTLLSQLGSRELHQYRNASRLKPLKYAYAISVCEDWQVVMATVLASSIRTNSPNDIIVLMGDHVSNSSLAVLVNTFDRIVYVDTMQVPIPKNMSEIECRGSYDKCRCWFSKFTSFALTDYDVVMYLDSDILMHSQCDHLFEDRRYPVAYQLWGKDPTFPPARAKPKTHLNWVPHGGMYLLRPQPNRAVYVWEVLRNLTREELDKHSIAKFVDQSFLYMLFPPHDKVPNGQGEHIGDWHVVHKYLVREEDIWRPDFQCGIHYPSDKPWEALSMFPPDPNHHDVFPWVDLWQKWAWRMCNSSYETESLAGSPNWGNPLTPSLHMRNGSVLDLSRNFTVNIADIDVSWPLSQRITSPECILFDRLEQLRLNEYLETCVLDGETYADFRLACSRFDYLIRHIVINSTHPGPRPEPLYVVIERTLSEKRAYDLAHPKKP